MFLRTFAVVLAVTAGVMAASTTQAAQIANGLATNGLTANGLTANGENAQGGRHEFSPSVIRLKAVILQDGSTIDLR
jgi:hypothetical protein